MNPIFRLFNCILQYSNDNGQSWFDVQGWATDFLKCLPQSMVAPYTPDELSPDQEPKCVASANVTAFLQNLINEVISIINAGGQIIAVASAIVALLAIVITIGAAAPLILAIASALVLLGSAGITAAFTPSL